ncbi:MAG: hypothetical protein PHW53_02020 [Patescibacteria group bacterium]|nr:hypothetical protein [Patescibacteria group bacterium]
MSSDESSTSIPDGSFIEILGVKFRRSANLAGRADFQIREDTGNPAYRMLEPCFRMEILVRPNVGERVRRALQENTYVDKESIQPRSPDKGWMRWKAIVRFKTAGDPRTEDGLHMREESIEFVWQRLVAILTEAVLVASSPRRERPLSYICSRQN